MPGGVLPVMEVDGIQLSQSMTIARFLANKFNLAGSNPLEKAQADMVVDCVTDFFNGMSKFSSCIIEFSLFSIHTQCITYTCILLLESVKIFFEKDEDKKKELEEKMQNETAPAFIKNMTTILTKNGGQYMVGKGVS